ncbi:hypothetical protein M409DRAFT_50237 [Zasmidium cellare ATCC 36951]|uniref:FAD-binding domain-containing protein n=1 Tax=Zasmidium cellare ATCC 36951 TaxID=1080233 RepID=A0A6A6D2Z7_ZASCE|nr:uncharacterized protein M409DRAFT_50237 [Zasmidium cellare ATCC 36951]KAF2172562.1 hypothetical protein M409DRAFT_50237 [Zasmidium cellare ATCC 36951]
MSKSEFHVAIIGAGLSGLSLALALQQQNIQCTLYEGRDAPLDTGGGLMLHPNGLKALQAIGVYETLLEKAWPFDNIYVQNGITGEILQNIENGSIEKYGMHAVRINRYTLLGQLLNKVRQSEIPIHFNRKYSHIVSETEEEVTWQFDDGSSASASILVGADGIHSAVRKYIAPDVKPIYGGFVTLVAAVPTAQFGLPERDSKNYNDPNNSFPMPGGIVVPQLGAFVASPETKSADKCMITVMRPFPREAERWTPIDNDKNRLRSILRENSEKFPRVVRNALSDIPDKQLRVWPAYTVPLLEHWTSANTGSNPKGRVVIIGDAAHALPPSSGQGCNQAFEDINSFAAVLGKLGNDLSRERLQKALRGWQLFRQERVDCVLRLNKHMETLRMPASVLAEKGITNDPETLKANLKKESHEVFKLDHDEAVRECWKRAHLE